MQKPPPPPRPLADHYVWQKLTTDAWTIAAFVFIILGAPFTFLGLALALAAVTWPIGILFVLIGLLFLLGGAAVVLWRYQNVKKIAEAIRAGETVEGQIVKVEKIMYIRAGTRRPWKIHYQFRVDGQTYTGQVRTWQKPGSALQPGQYAYVLYLPQAPQWNVLYPQPQAVVNPLPANSSKSRV